MNERMINKEKGSEKPSLKATIENKIIQLQAGYEIRINRIINQEDGSYLGYGNHYMGGFIGSRKIGEVIIKYDSDGVFQEFLEGPGINKMDKKTAEILMDELEKRIKISEESKKVFIDTLVSTSFPESSRFYETLHSCEPENLKESGLDHSILLRRILRNKNAKYQQLRGWKKVHRAAAFSRKRYSSTAVTRTLREDKDLVEMMQACKYPYSLLSKVQTIDYQGDDAYRITRPILLIPDAKDTKKISEFEQANTIYEIDARFGWKKIPPQA